MTVLFDGSIFLSNFLFCSCIVFLNSFCWFCLCSWTTLNFFKWVILNSLTVHRFPYLYSQSLDRYSFPFLVSLIFVMLIFVYVHSELLFQTLQVCFGRYTLLLVSSVVFLDVSAGNVLGLWHLVSIFVWSNCPSSEVWGGGLGSVPLAEKG